jgi:uncharacterized membrane protein YdjX (TVP38/TMEM64 family)
MAEVRRFGPYLKLALLVAIVAGAALLIRLTPLGEHLTREAMVGTLEALRSSLWAPLVFVLVYSVATALALPGSLITIVGGAVFGFGWGALLNSIGANIGANAAFKLARGLGREGVERIVGHRLRGLDRATEQHGFWGLLILRLVPLVPFNALNFGSGLTAIRWRDYALATVLGIVPGTLVYTFFADALAQGAAGASEAARTRLWIAGGLLAALSIIPLLARRLGFRLPSSSSSEAAQ